MKILFVTSECAPFVKTGGLADVAGALPRELAARGAEVRVILPMYRAISPEYRDQMEHVVYFYINLGWRRQYVGIEKLCMNGVTWYFVDNEQYFGREYVYGRGGDECERFAYFCKAVLEALAKIDYIPDIIHLNDWQTGLIPPLLRAQYAHLPLYKSIKTVFTIHNMQFQGVFPIDQTEELVSLGSWAYTPDNLEFYGSCSFMKGGLVFSDHITTVSSAYAKEILTPYYGERLDGLMRASQYKLTGILNGIDTTEYNPETDPFIARDYTAETYLEKAENKRALQEDLGLDADADAPLIGMVTRLSAQKGLDLIERVLDGIMATGAQLVVLGMGDSKYVDLLGWAQWKYKGRLATSFQMNPVLAHRIYAGADLFLMPSMFEPCGLSQMIALRYGTLPIVRETGGLRDTVLSYNEFTGEGNGFTFFNYNAHDMLHVIERATNMYREQRDVFAMLAKRAMSGSYGWNESAKKYLALYSAIIEDGKAEDTPEAPEAPEADAKAPEANAAEAPEAPAQPAPAKKPRAPRKKPKAEAVPETPETPEAKETPAPAKKPRAPRKKPQE